MIVFYNFALGGKGVQQCFSLDNEIAHPPAYIKYVTNRIDSYSAKQYKKKPAPKNINCAFVNQFDSDASDSNASSSEEDEDTVRSKKRSRRK